MPMEYTGSLKFSTTLLHVAVSCGDTRIMEYFIELGADLNVTAYDPDENTFALPKVAPLHIAVEKGVSPISHGLLNNPTQYSVWYVILYCLSYTFTGL